MGCCCAPQSDRKDRSTRRDIDAEEGKAGDMPSTHIESEEDKKSISSKDGEMKEPEAGNIVTDTLGHLVGPDSARNSLEIRQIPTGQASFHTVFSCIQLLGGDKIAMYDFPAKAVSVVRDACIQHWPNGIQSESTGKDREHVFKLKGNPWFNQWTGTVDSRRLVMGLIGALYNNGWVLNLTSDVCQSGVRHKALMFRQQDPAPTRCDWMCVAFVQVNASHKLEMINVPADVVSIMTEALEAMTTKHSVVSGTKVHEFELKHNPFFPGGATPLAELLLTLLPALEKCGFTVSTSVNECNNGSVDTWYCCRPIGWSPGLPVFHR